MKYVWAVVIFVGGFCLGALAEKMAAIYEEEYGWKR